MASGTIAPGARVLIRGAEWIIKRKDVTGTGGQSLLAIGVSEFVRGREARFLTEIDKSITVLDPAETELVPDSSPQFKNSRLYLESLLRQSPSTGNDLWIGHRAAVDDLPYQLEPALLALQQPRHRILIADAVGLGKTIEIGILLSELIHRGKAKRILVVTTKAMMAQFQKELWCRFTIPLVRLDSIGLERVRRQIPANVNPFHYYDKSIVSIDTLKQNLEFRAWADRSHWDVIVIDEAHNVAVRGGGQSLRSKVADLLSRKSDTLIMASATPHDGKAESFASLMNMLDPTAIADASHYIREDIKGLFLRRHKKDIQQQIAGAFLERTVTRHCVPASAEEEQVYELLAEARFAGFDKAKRSGQLLFKTVIEKALFSSPQAALATVRQRLNKIKDDTSPEASKDRDTLQELETALTQIGPAQFAKYQQLLKMLRPGGSLDWKPDKNDRIVIFTERIETLRFLEENLARDLKLKANQIRSVHGAGDSDVDLQETVEEFGRDTAPVRILLASDIASEGLNLHYLCHKLIHFDIPWSLMTFQQRNGRVDRYGQEQQPHIHYLYTEPKHEKIRGDIRILELLMQKDDMAARNIGDPSAFANVFDAAEEEVITGKAIEDNLSTEEFDRKMEETAKNDLWHVLFGDELPSPDGTEARDRCHAYPSLYNDDFDYFRVGLTALSDIDLQDSHDPARRLTSVTINQDLRRIFRTLPGESLPDDGRLHLTTDRALVKKAIKDSRAQENRWPDVHLLWNLHPIMEWLNFKLMVAFGRTKAPLIRLHTLPPGERLFLLLGEIPNRQGQPVIHEWFAVRFDSMAAKGILSLVEFLERSRFHKEQFPNPGNYDVEVAVASLIKDAVVEGRAYMSRKRKEWQAAMDGQLENRLADLNELQSRQEVFLEERYPDADLTAVQRNRKQQRRRRIEDIFADHRRFVSDTLTTEDAPFLRVAAVFIG